MAHTQKSFTIFFHFAKLTLLLFDLAICWLWLKLSVKNIIQSELDLLALWEYFIVKSGNKIPSNNANNNKQRNIDYKIPMNFEKDTFY
jgi:hypothetical protein